MIRFYKTPLLLRRQYPELIWSTASADSIHLTFDDGPHAEITPWVLNELDKFNAKATFFCLGANLEKHPELGKQILLEGHRLANHSYSHLDGWKTKNNVYLEDLKLGKEVVQEFGVENPHFRPPYGRIRKRQIAKITEPIVMWSHLSWDFEPSLNLAKSLSAMKAAGPGSILTFHDSWKAFDNLRVLLPELLEHFRTKGLLFKTLADD